MQLRTVTASPSFARALAWMEHRRGPAPSGWLPQGLDRLDDTWLAHHPTRGARRPPAAALEGLPAPLATRARGACGLEPAPVRQLPRALCELCARWCWADLVDLPPQTDDEPDLLHQGLAARSDAALAETLPRLSTRTVHRAVSLAGLKDLGGLLAGAPDRAAATICGRLPTPWRARVWQARATSSTPGRAALAELATLTRTGDPTEVLFSLGASRFASLLAPRPLSLRQTAQLLPVPVARHLLGASAGTGIQETESLASALREAMTTVDTPQI